AMDITLRLTVRTDLHSRYPQCSLPQGQVAATEQSGYHVCTGIGPDLREAAREAVRELVDVVVARHGHSRQEAYAIASVAADLRIHEIVNVPNWVVGAFLPDAIFTTTT
ncbi:MAG TPA: acetamidase/formamidase family protein, partial [Solirubrobacteraceae bacterium]|nr:acetamidase/formamidase family protein [Solirubrobacteraceae bacterium]